MSLVADWHLHCYLNTYVFGLIGTQSDRFVNVTTSTVTKTFALNGKEKTGKTWKTMKFLTENLHVCFNFWQLSFNTSPWFAHQKSDACIIFALPNVLSPFPLGSYSLYLYTQPEFRSTVRDCRSWTPSLEERILLYKKMLGYCRDCNLLKTCDHWEASLGLCMRKLKKKTVVIYNLIIGIH